MSKNLPNRAGMLVLAAMAACALAAPSAGSAASWSAVGSTHVLDASTFAFFAGGAITAGATCTTARFHTHVQSGAVLTITGATFSGCTGTGGITACSAVVTATKLPWSATAIASNNLRIDGFHIGANFTGASCPLPTTATVTGSIIGSPSSSTWDFFSHTMTFNHATGLSTHFGAGVGTFPTTATTALRDTTQTLTVT
ncbi:MAG TPA: hypothetical protein VFY45_11965 [Baekduia sp.]|nr:hypothetical protein [Baekduia sp.]